MLDPTKNAYSKVSFQRLCLEFNLGEYPDFRWKGGNNHGLGCVFTYYPSGPWCDNHGLILDLQSLVTRGVKEVLGI